MYHDFNSKGEVPTYPGHLTVYRAMEVLHSGIMESPMRPFKWTGDENRAECVGDGKVAAKNCSCGFYAYFSPDHARQYLTWGYLGNMVMVVCQAYGRMSVGEFGVRAEKMKVVGVIPRVMPDDFEEIQANAPTNP